MVRLALILALVGCASWVAHNMAWAQTEAPRLAELRINVWPEYDQPSVLVIYDATLAEAVTNPIEMSWPIPAAARVNAVAYRDATGNLLTLPFEVTGAEGGQAAAFTVDQPQFIIEYYADILAPPPNRSFDLALTSPLAADQVTLTVRQPSRADQMQITPALPEAGVDNLGNPQYSGPVGPLAAGQVIDLAVSYTKADADPSVSATSPLPTEPVQPAETGLPPWVAWIIGVVGGAAVAGLALFGFSQYRKRQRTGGSRQARRRREREANARAGTRGAAPSGASPATGADRFCRQCGQAFAANDRFCRNCGAPRR